jgi:hypothetical protein
MMLLFATTANAQKAKYQSIFIYNFTKYIKWPDSRNSGDFVIGILGNSDLQADLQDMASSKKETNGMPITVKKLSSAAEGGNCHIMIVSDKDCDNIDAIAAHTNGKPVLIITDKPGMGGKGAVINFVEQEGKIKFELNQSQAEKRGLKVSGSLTQLAILI